MRKSQPEELMLPKRAREWLDAYCTQQKNQGLANDQKLEKAYTQIDKLAACLNLPEYSLRTFRDLHFLALPESSVAGLPINDDLFLSVIRADAFTIEELEQKLANGEISAETLGTQGNNQNGAGLLTLKEAVVAWRQSQQEAAA